MIIGITGTNGAGKGTVVEYLAKKEWNHFSAGEFITEEIKKRKMTVDRDSMILVANDLRQKFGTGYIVEELIRRAKEKEGNSIVESVRTLGEVEKVKQASGVLLAVVADQKTRFERIKLRGSLKDGVDFEKFAEQENLEMESTDPNKQNLKACGEVADYVIENNGTIEELNRKIEDMLKIIQR